MPVEKDYQGEAVNKIVVNQRTVACDHIILYIDLVASAFPDAGMQEDQQFYEFDEDLRVRRDCTCTKDWVRPMIVGLYFCFVADPRLFAAAAFLAGHIIPDFLWDAAQCAYRHILSSRRRFSPLGEILCDEMEALRDCSSGMGHFLSQT